MANELLEEIYKIRENLAKEADYDLRKLVANVKRFAMKNKLAASPKKGKTGAGQKRVA